MGWQRSNVVRSGSRRRRYRRRSGARRYRTRRSRPYPFAAPLIVIAAGFFAWATFAPQAPAIAAAWWASVAGFVESGDWVPPSSPEPVASSGSDGTLTGRASVIDADTLEIHGERIRLLMIDAPEAGQRCYVDGSPQRCGQRAANALADWIAGRPVACVGLDIDRYGRTVATCSVGGADVGRWLVRNGHAVAYRNYGDDYICDEAEAARAGRGIWASNFVEPSQWRRLPDEARDDPPAGRYNPGWPDWCW